MHGTEKRLVSLPEPGTLVGRRLGWTGCFGIGSSGGFFIYMSGMARRLGLGKVGFLCVFVSSEHPASHFV